MAIRYFEIDFCRRPGKKMFDKPDVACLIRIRCFIGVQSQSKYARRYRASRRRPSERGIHIAGCRPLIVVIGDELVVFVGKNVACQDVFPVSGLNSNARGANKDAGAVIAELRESGIVCCVVFPRCSNCNCVWVRGKYLLVAIFAVGVKTLIAFVAGRIQ